MVPQGRPGRRNVVGVPVWGRRGSFAGCFAWAIAAGVALPAAEPSAAGKPIPQAKSAEKVPPAAQVKPAAPKKSAEHVQPAAASKSSPRENSAAEARVSFTRQVQAVLTKAGCNQGTCHGNAGGKGGFKLSLRGEDLAYDHEILTRQSLGRRINVVEPERSLLLLKGLGEVPHEGGKRLDRGSPHYLLLRDWIAQGIRSDAGKSPRLLKIEVEPAEAYLDPQQSEIALKVFARFEGEERRDVTADACYDSTHPTTVVAPNGIARRARFGEANVLVRYLGRQTVVPLVWIPPRTDYRWPEPPTDHPVDRLLEEKLRILRVVPAPLCADHVFLRRAHLDLLGIPPTAEEAAAFVADSDPAKREKLIDRLLERPEYADFWAQKWADLLRIEERTLDAKGVQVFFAWIRDGIAADRPLHEFAADLTSAEGSTYTNPPTNYWRALREPFLRAETTAQVFLGVRLQCARCHNHPFDRWTQHDYYAWTNLFARVDYKIVSNRRPDDNDKHQFDGEQIVFASDKGAVEHPKTGSPPPPQLLGAGAPLDPKLPRLQGLGAWLADPANPFFAPMQTNRVWYHLLGRGIVDPIDDFRATNPPSHPKLLNELTRRFVAGGFRVKPLLRLIMTSRAYQRSTAIDETNAADDGTFARAIPRRAPAESLLDALHQVCDVPARFTEQPDGTRATQLPGVVAQKRKGPKLTPDEEFLRLFGKPPRLLACECERSNDATLVQSMQMVSGPVVDDLITHSQNRIGKLLAAGASDAEIVNSLFLNGLSRPPSEAEKHAALGWIEKSGNRRTACEDLLWSIVNSKEFTLRQ